MKDFVKAVDGLPWIVKLIIAIFPGVSGVVFGIYRIAKGNVLIGLIWIFTGALFQIGAIIDFITILLYKKVTFLV